MKIRHIAPEPDNFSPDTEFFTDEGEINIRVWLQLLRLAGHAKTPLPTGANVPRSLAQAMGAVRGVMEALAFTRIQIPKDEWQLLGLDLAEDLIIGIGERRHHPALKYWIEKKSEPGSFHVLPTEVTVQTAILAVCQVL